MKDGKHILCDFGLARNCINKNDDVYVEHIIIWHLKCGILKRETQQ